MVAWFRRRALLRASVDAQWAAVREDMEEAFGAQAVGKLPGAPVLCARSTMPAGCEDAAGVHQTRSDEPVGRIIIPDDRDPVDDRALYGTLVHEALHAIDPGERQTDHEAHSGLYLDLAASFVEAMTYKRPLPAVPQRIGAGEHAMSWPQVTPEQQKVVDDQFASRVWRRTAGHASIYAGPGAR